MKTSVLIVDDDADISRHVQSALSDAGYEARRVKSADEAAAFLRRRAPDLLLLDIQLPGISGLKLLEMLRQQPETAGLPVIMLTVLGDESQRIRGLKAGADDYLVKPFSVKELLARVEALLRRSRVAAAPSSVVEAEGLSLDADRRLCAIRGKPVALTPIEFDLLGLFLRRQGYVLTYETLSESLCRADVMTSETLYAHVKNLRRKLGRRGAWIETVHGIGYRFQAS